MKIKKKKIFNLLFFILNIMCIFAYMKVIFLDIDGVMNSQLFYERRHKRRWLRPITYYYKITSKIKYVLKDPDLLKDY